MKANKCDCGKYIDEDEYYCVDCELRDEQETAWWDEEIEDSIIRSVDVDELQNVSLKLLNNGGEYIE